MEKTNVRIIIAAHKRYRMPADSMYVPLQVGAGKRAEQDDGIWGPEYVRDDTGENISDLNPSFCELTGLFWAWKNLDADYIGLVHYRRHFSLKRKRDLWSSVLTYEQLRPYLGKVKVFVPVKRKYYIETLYSHYQHTHYASQLDEMRNVIDVKYPDHVSSYDRVVKHRYGYMFNMMVMEKDCYNEYCSWLFDILFEMRKSLGEQEELSAYQGRFYGRLAEIALNIWLDKKIGFGELHREEVMELPCIHMEKINWWKKGTAFCKAKFFGVKYEGSF